MKRKWKRCFDSINRHLQPRFDSTESRQESTFVNNWVQREQIYFFFSYLCKHINMFCEMNIEEVREYTLSLFGVTEDQPFGDDIITFRLEGKIFVCLWLGGGEHDMKESSEPRLALKLLPERNEELRSQFAAVTPAWHWNKKHWSDVYYEQVEDALVQEWIRESYQLVASKLPKATRQKYI